MTEGHLLAWGKMSGFRISAGPAMKCVTLLLAIIFLGLSTNSFAQTITYSGKKIPVSRALEVIKKQTNYAVVFNPAHLLETTPVTIDVKNMEVETYLKTILEKQPLGYSMVKNTIIVYQVEKKATALPPASIVSGTVTNTRGEPMDGASVVVLRTKEGTMANAKGEFVLKNLEETDSLIISQIGYNTRRVSVMLKPGEASVKVILADATNPLDEVVMRAYGTTSQRLSTGNISRVTAKDIETQPVMNPLLALEGRVPGLNITRTSGFASSPVNVELRGRTGLASAFSTEPLYVVDGVPIVTLDLKVNGTIDMGGRGYQGFMSNKGTAQLFSAVVTGGQSPLFSINPKDIESIEVLKDADATSLYGSRGANGVILITLKKGKAGPAQFSLDITQGVDVITHFRKMMNTSEYLQIRREAFKNDGIIPTPLNAPDLMVWDTTRNVDWQRELYGGTGKRTSVQAALSGGNAQTTFRLSTNYDRSTNITTVSGATQRLTFASALTYRSPDQKFSLNLGTSFTYSVVNAIGVGGPELPPNAPAIFDKKGNLNWAEWNAGGETSAGLFPFASLLQPNKQRSNTLRPSLNLGYKLFKGLEFTTSLAYSNGHHWDERYFPSISQNPLTNPSGMSTFGTTYSSNWLIEPKVSYESFIGKGTLGLMVGGTLQSDYSQALNQYALGYSDDDLLKSLNNAAFVTNLAAKSYSKLIGTIAEIRYSFAQKLILNLSGRRDGHSNFGPGRRFGNFGSIGAAWIASEEKWLKEVLPSYIPFLKIQGSYGSLGSASVGEYQYTSQWGILKNGVGIMPPYGDVQPLVNMHAVNPDYRWQVNKKLYTGITLGFFDNSRLELNAGYYNERTGNQLLLLPTAMLTGFSQVLGNLDAVIENIGLEAALNARIIQKKQFSWSVSFNIAANRNKLVAFPGLANSAYASYYRIGEPTNLEYVFQYKGIDPLTGLPGFYDNNKDGKIVENLSNMPGTGEDDRNVIINLSPKYAGGLSTSLVYRNFSFSAGFDFTKKLVANEFTYLQIGAMNNLPVEVLGNYWRAPGDQTIFSKPSLSGDSFFKKSDRSYADGSFFKMNSFTCKYRLPENMVKKIGTKDCSVSLNASNIFVVTAFKGLDPLVPLRGMPSPRTIVANLSFTF